MMTTERAGDGIAASEVKILDNPSNLHKGDGRLSVRERIARGPRRTAHQGLAQPRQIINRPNEAKKTCEIATMMHQPMIEKNVICRKIMTVGRI